MDVGQKIRIVPRWEMHTCCTDRVNIVIEPGPSFGTGDHPSTVMALELLEAALADVQRFNIDPSVIDVGTGTGVLAIAAKSLGAGLVVALDIDLVSVLTTCTKNVELNKQNWTGSGTHSPLCFMVGEMAAVSGQFHIVVANLAAPLLIRLRDDLVAATSSHLIVSGIADEMCEQLREVYCENMGIIAHKKRSGWNAFLLNKL